MLNAAPGGNFIHEKNFSSLAVKIRNLAQSTSTSGQSSSTHPNPGDKNDINIFNAINQILYPLVQGCETKDVKVVRLCLGLMQRLIVHKVLDFKGMFLVFNRDQGP